MLINLQFSIDKKDKEKKQDLEKILSKLNEKEGIQYLAKYQE
jgi:hypothetical protein